MTHRQRMLKAARGEMADRIPYVPRIDLWYAANKYRGTLPKEHQGRTAEEISRAEGWAMHKLVPEFLNVKRPEDNIDRSLGIYNLKEMPFRTSLPDDVERTVKKEGDRTTVEYHTPVGSVRTVLLYTEEMKRAGISITWIDEHLIKKPEDYKVVGYIFRNLKVEPYFDDYIEWQKFIGDDGLAVAFFGLGASPMHHIMKEFLDPTSFYYHMRDYEKEMLSLAEDMEPYFEKALDALCKSPAEAVLWGANYDDMITYPPFFRDHITPWLQKASRRLGEAGKVLISHCDGENLGLLDLIRDSGIHVAEAICPYPMTKVKIDEYYRRWHEKLTIFGGIPSNILLADLATDEDLENYLKELLAAVHPGTRYIAGIADTTPPDAVFDRLRRIGEFFEENGKLPLKKIMVTAEAAAPAEEAAGPVTAELEPSPFEELRQAVIKGDHEKAVEWTREFLNRSADPMDIMHDGLIAAMDFVGENFKAGTVFIPEVLLSARAMNRAIEVLAPHLPKSDVGKEVRVVLGTVKGDMHDIGKNMVGIMFKAAGFNVIDLGVNVPEERFVKEVKKEEAAVLGLSALLTTTMPHMKGVIEALEAAGIRSRVKVVVGGAPVNEMFAKEIGADGYAPDAGSAVQLVKRLLAG